MSQMSCHFCNLSGSFWNKEGSLCVLIGMYKMQSSAKSHTLVDRLSDRSFVRVSIISTRFAVPPTLR